MGTGLDNAIERWENTMTVSTPLQEYLTKNPEYTGYRRKASEEEPAPLTGGSSDYYKFPAGATELIDLIEHKQMSFAVGNIFKAVYRLGGKPGVSHKYDLEKIIYFAERELARL